MKLILFICLVVLAAQLKAQNQQKAVIKKITGRVLNNKSNDPIAGATVSTSDLKYTTQTDSSGYFQLRIPDTIDRIIISSSGFNTSNINVTNAAESLSDRKSVV